MQMKLNSLVQCDWSNKLDELSILSSFLKNVCLSAESRGWGRCWNDMSQALRALSLAGSSAAAVDRLPGDLVSTLSLGTLRQTGKCEPLMWDKWDSTPSCVSCLYS